LGKLTDCIRSGRMHQLTAAWLLLRVSVVKQPSRGKITCYNSC